MIEALKIYKKHLDNARLALLFNYNTPNAVNNLDKNSEYQKKQHYSTKHIIFFYQKTEKTIKT